jgi:putative (di)nucleoside polyphosphate hydrolase
MSFRPNVAAIIINDEGNILVGERSDVAGSWQLPQGGVEENENKTTAVLREIEEETGLKPADLEILNSTDDICYTFPEYVEKKMGFKGQCQTFFLIKVKNSECTPEISDEFSSFEWINKEEVIKRVVDFKKESYIEAFRQIFGENDG